MSKDDQDLEALLRQALRERADLVQPTGDGLAKIQERAARRHRRMAWLRPSIAAVAAALAVLAAVGIPALVNRSGPSGQDAASQGLGSHSAATPRAKATPRKTTPKTAAPSPGATPNRVQGVPAWPYRDSADAMASAGANSELTDPATLAVKFVKAFVSLDANITPEPAVDNGKIATVQIVRSDLSQRPVCTVQLQRISPNSRAYVVTAAETDKLTMKPVEPIEGSTSVRVAGTVQPTTATVNTVYSGLLLPNGSTNAKRVAAQPTDLNPQNRTWSITVNTQQQVTRPGIVAAWTVDLKGDVLDFAAQPAD